MVSVILLIFGFGAVVWELGYYEDSDRLFHYTMVALYLFLILLSLIYAIASTVIKSLVSKILFYESDPEKYVQVFFSVYRSDKKSYLTWQAAVSYYNEDFEACLRYCDEIEKLNKPKIMYYAALNRAKVAFMKGDRETFAAETEKMLTFSANMKRKSVRTTAKKTAEQHDMLLDLLDGKIDEAKKRADELFEVSEYPMTEAVLSYYRGLVYKAAGEKQKAIHCFMTASEKGGKMFIKAKSDEALNELLEENISSDHIQ